MFLDAALVEQVIGEANVTYELSMYATTPKLGVDLFLRCRPTVA